MKHHFRHATVMIVDDEPDNLNVLGEMLEREGLSVRAFPCGKKALAAASVEPPDLVLLDIRMPTVDGFETCRLMKADEHLESVPVIFLSAFAGTEDKVRAFAAGGVDYVTKPFSETEVLARVHTHLRLRNQRLHLESLVAQRVQQLTEAHRRLRIWDGAKTQWLNTLAHELRTPLTEVFAVTELLLMERRADTESSALRESFDLSCGRINKLIDDAATLTRIDIAAERYDVRPLQLATLLQSAVEEAAARIPRRIRSEALETAKPVCVLAESELLTRAFTDLLLTAGCCACESDAVSLGIAPSCKQVTVRIVTGGKTLSPEALATFFEVGGQHTLLTPGGDFGLGAALASRIIRLFNGSVSIQNGERKGLVLDISLPCE